MNGVWSRRKTAFLYWRYCTKGNLPKWYEKMEVKWEKAYIWFSFNPLPEEECVNIYGFDISNQKELEEKFRESEEKYRNIIEVANEGIWILDSEAKTTYVNNKIAEMLGYSQEEMIGRFVWDFIDEKR